MERKITDGAERKELHRIVLFVLAFVVTIVCIGTGSIQQRETVQVGSVATKRYVAPEDTVDEAATEKLREAAANSVGPIYKTDTTVMDKNVTMVEGVFQELDTVLAGLPEGESFYNAVQEISLELPVVLSNRQLMAYENLTAEQRKAFANDCVSVLKEIYDKGVTADGLTEAKASGLGYLQELAWSSDLKTMAGVILSAAVEPNLIVDEAAVEAAKEEKRAEVDEVLIRKNQKIVDEGEIITQEIYDKLVALNLVSETGLEGSLMPMLGSLVITGMLFAALYLFFRWGKGNILLKPNEIRMLFTIYMMMVLLIRILANLTIFTIVPVGLFAMLVSLLVGRRMALWLNALFCIIGCFIFNGDVQFLMYALISGTFAALIIQKTDKRSHLIPAALGMAAVDFVTTISLGFFFGEGYSAELLLQSGIGAVTGLLSMIVAVGSLPFWENMFEANTPLRLMELTNPNNELLRKLMIEAPGTYHHSLIVANLAETAVYDIGGNTALARAGAYYHDVGKLRYPQFFAENQSGHNPHDELPPEKSAKIITGHTKGGLELAERYKLPPVVRDMIVEHHGNSLVKFFYFKALKLYGAENVNEADYRYQGRIPSSRESAVVMLADTVEAAVRSMLGHGKTMEEAEAAVKSLMKDKLDDGQLNNSGLTLNELETIRLAFLKVFHGMYHERVSYPEQKEIQEAAKQKADTEQEETNSDSTD
ncbi:HD family phosphohydrolase [Anaerotignum sp.]|uniref:HD family phosphohydrolase n=1 Tax=Anaerotignum sp. TaxID=2039241 RepID=UPI0029DD8D40|nr:HDIG domain-containing metalloprotein [Anaerotignum sp.]MCI6057630.1 HDIG domain-containing protein [Clostridia bacterium]MDY3596057.1 HDIG domain-containing protein [Anaerotignum sp.]